MNILKDKKSNNEMKKLNREKDYNIVTANKSVGFGEHENLISLFNDLERT